MKNKKRVISLILIVAIISISLFSFIACDNKPETEQGEKVATLVIIDKNKNVVELSDDTNVDYVADWLIELNSEGKLTLTYVNSQYGMDIRTLNGIEVNGATKYFALYTNDADNTNSAWGTYTHKGIECASSSYGASYLPVKNGMTYILEYSEYNA